MSSACPSRAPSPRRRRGRARGPRPGGRSLAGAAPPLGRAVRGGGAGRRPGPARQSGGSVAPAGCWSEAQHPRRERRVRRVQRRVFEGLGRHRGSDRARRGDDVRGRPEGAARDLSRALHAEEDQRGPGQVPGLRGRRRRRGGVGPG
ncbi:unnamed protein product, partial [Prorocentrum cordatum]